MATRRVIAMTEAELLAEMERQIGAPVEPTAKEKIRRYVHRVSFEERRAVTVSELVQQIGSPYGTVTSQLVRLRDEGQVVGSCRLGFVGVR